MVLARNPCTTIAHCHTYIHVVRCNEQDEDINGGLMREDGQSRVPSPRSASAKQGGKQQAKDSPNGVSTSTKTKTKSESDDDERKTANTPPESGGSAGSADASPEFEFGSKRAKSRTSATSTPGKRRGKQKGTGSRRPTPRVRIPHSPSTSTGPSPSISPRSAEHFQFPPSPLPGAGADANETKLGPVFGAQADTDARACAQAEAEADAQADLDGVDGHAVPEFVGTVLLKLLWRYVWEQTAALMAEVPTLGDIGRRWRSFLLPCIAVVFVVGHELISTLLQNERNYYSVAGRSSYRYWVWYNIVPPLVSFLVL